MSLRFPIYFSAFCLSLVSFAQSKPESERALKAEFAACPEMGGSSYYAYPGPLQQAYTPPPAGYKPFYISHYGRHGSRYLTEDSRYTDILRIFDSHELTEFGKDVRRRLQVVWDDARGCGGDLTPVGERQHHDIAQRMIIHYPTLFEANSEIRAVASTSRRCMMSMMAFCEGLKELSPGLKITRSAHEKDMEYINHESPELKAFTARKGEWWTSVMTPYIRNNFSVDRMRKTLFVSDMDDDTMYFLIDGLYWVTHDMQNVELGNLSFYDLWTPDELYVYWTCQNLKMYTTNGPSVANGGVTSRSSVNLLRQIIAEANEAIAHGTYRANLRFGHDSALIRLLTLMQAGGCSATASDDKVATVWQDFRISPMAANLQLIFFRNGEGNILVKLLLNENEITLPVQGESGPYYSWAAVEKFWTAKLTD